MRDEISNFKFQISNEEPSVELKAGFDSSNLKFEIRNFLILSDHTQF